MALFTANNGASYDAHDSIEKNRSLIASATKDSLDQLDVENVVEKEQTLVDDTTMSIASTVDVDNTSCYLKRFADKFAHENKTRNHEEVQTLFVKINKYKMDQVIIYTGHGCRERGTVVDVYYEDNNKPRYNIELLDGYIEAHVGEDELERWDKEEDLGSYVIKSRAPSIPSLDERRPHTNVVDFDSKCTPLFSALYSGEFDKAKRILDSHPEEASTWVIRYDTTLLKRKSGCEYRSVRWKLLPLHLFIILAGSNEYTDQKPGEASFSPLELLAALLSAYPHATKCIDDQHMIPLHASIRGHSSPDIIKALVNASFDSVVWKDIKGRDAFGLLNQVFKKLMKRAVVSAETGDETHDALRIREWKQEVLNILNNAATHYRDIAKQPDAKMVEPTQNKTLKGVTHKSCCEEDSNANTKYLQIHFSSADKSTATKNITPCSTMTSVTEVITPTSIDQDKQEDTGSSKESTLMSWEARCRMLELESCDSEDKFEMVSPSDRTSRTNTEAIIDKADSSSIFRARGTQPEEVVKQSNAVAGSSDVKNNPESGHGTVLDSSKIMAAIFSYDSEDESQTNVVCLNAFEKEAIPSVWSNGNLAQTADT